MSVHTATIKVGTLPGTREELEQLINERLKVALMKRIKEDNKRLERIMLYGREGHVGEITPIGLLTKL